MPVYTLEIIVVALGLLMLMLDAFAKLEDKKSIAWLGVLGLIVVFCLLFRVEMPDAEAAKASFWKFYSPTGGLSIFFKGIAVLTTIIVLIMAADHSAVVVTNTANPEPGAHKQAGLGEFFALPLFACAGLMWMASANNLVSIFVSLELVTITFYVLVAYLRRNVGSLEAGVKYLILGALSTGFLVYGFAWLFGITGSMDLGEIKTALADNSVNSTAALFAFALILVAMAFKVGAAPFHMWIPDVYQGAPTPITAFRYFPSTCRCFPRQSISCRESYPDSRRDRRAYTADRKPGGHSAKKLQATAGLLQYCSRRIFDHGFGLFAESQ